MIESGEAGFQYSRAIAYVLPMVALAWGILALAPVPDDTLLWLEIRNAGHIFLFGLLAVGIAAALKRGQRERVPDLRRYFIALCLAAIVGGASELAQYFGPRNASLMDLLRNAIGAFSFLAIVWHRPSRKGRINSATVAVLAAALALLCITTWPVGKTAVASYLQARVFPTLMAPGSFSSNVYLDPANSTLTTVDTPAGFSANAGQQQSLRIQLSGGRWSGLAIADTPSDWRKYSVLEFPLYAANIADTPVLYIRLYDRTDGWQRREWATIEVAIDKADQSVSVSIDELEIRMHKRAFDLQSVARVYFYFPGSAPEAELFFGEISLR